MIDFHTHTFFSDGQLSPAEHIRRALVAGYKFIGLTDHVDFSNIEDVYRSVKKMCDEAKECGWDITAVPGVEITHVPAKKIGDIVKKARDMGIPLVIVHGESPVEPVEKGTNRAAIEAGVDILAHPGLIEPADMERAAELGINIEITARKGHSITNGYVAALAEKFGNRLVLDSDSHIHTDFLTESFRQTVMVGCGLSEKRIAALEENCRILAKTIMSRL